MNQSVANKRVSSAASDAGRHRILREVHTILEVKIDRPLGASFMKDIDLALRKKTLNRA